MYTHGQIETVINRGRPNEISCEINLLEIKNGGRLDLLATAKIGVLKMNLDVNLLLPRSQKLSLDISNNSSSVVTEIESMFCRIDDQSINTRLNIKNAFFELPEDTDSNIYSPHSEKVKFDKLAWGGIRIIEDEEGIRVVPKDLRDGSRNSKGNVHIYLKNTLEGKHFFAAISSNKMSFLGNVSVPGGDIVIRGINDTSIKGDLHAGRYLITESSEGKLSIHDSNLAGKQIVTYGEQGAYIFATNTKAEEWLIESLNGDVVLSNVKSDTNHIVLLSEKGQVGVNESDVRSSSLKMTSSQGVVMNESKIVSSHDMIKTFGSVVMLKTNIDINAQGSYVVLGDFLSDDEASLINLDEDHNIKLLGIVNPHGTNGDKPQYGGKQETQTQTLHMQDGRVFSREPVTGDGNCFYRSAADQLKKLGITNHGINYTHEELRAASLDYINVNKDQGFGRDLLTRLADRNPNGLHGDLPANVHTMDGYLAFHRENGAWADSGMVGALAQHLDVSLRIYSNGSPATYNVPQSGVIETLTLNLLYTGSHYDSLVQVDESIVNP